MYPAELTEPMRQDLITGKVVDLRTPAAVDEFVALPGPVLVFVNSVCGCAAGAARPGLLQALGQTEKRPAVGSVFAGVDTDATKRAREHFGPFPASSPSAALLVDGEVVWMLHRHQIEGRSAAVVAQTFQQAFAAHC